MQIDASTTAEGRGASAPGAADAPIGAASIGTASIRLPRITIYQAIPKGSTFDEMIRALVQFGASRVCPIVTERTVVRPGASSARGDRWNRGDRWRRIAREAVQQSGAAGIVQIDDPIDVAELTPATDALALLLHTQPLAQTTLHGYLGEIPAEVEIVVGPEGGFTDHEIDGLVASGFQPLWLGPHVLRSESAALFAVAALRLLVLERNDWQPKTTSAS